MLIPPPPPQQAVTARYDVEYAEHLRIMTTMYTEFLLAMLQWPEVGAWCGVVWGRRRRERGEGVD